MGQGTPVTQQEQLSENRTAAAWQFDDTTQRLPFLGKSTLASQSLAPVGWGQPPFLQRIHLAREHRQERILLQLVMIIEIFVSQAQSEHALLNQFL